MLTYPSTKNYNSERNNRTGTRPQFWLYIVIGRLFFIKMTLSYISNKKDKLAAIHKAVKLNLERRTDWQAYNSKKWRLRFVGIMNDGTLQAIVVWQDAGIFNKEQYIGISWETAFDDAGLNAL